MSARTIRGPGFWCVLACWVIAKPAWAIGNDLRIQSPKAGDAWCVGSQHEIAWKAAKAPAGATIKIEFSGDGGKQWTPIAAAAANSGKFLWKITQKPTQSARIKITLNPSGPMEAIAADFAILPSQEVAYEWINVTNKAAFAPRDGAGALVYKNKMWLLGGWNPGDKKFFPRICNNEVWSSADGKTWNLEKPNTFLNDQFDPAKDWEGRHTAGYVVYQDKMWIVGGDANQKHYQNDVWNSANGKNWTFVNKGKPVPWGSRCLHYTLVFKDKIWVLGGQSMPQFAGGKEAFHRDIWTTTDGIDWQHIKPKEPYWSARGMIGGAVVFKDRIWWLGGGTYDTPDTPRRNFYNDVWSSANGIDWTQHVAAAPWAPRQYHEVAVFDDRMWVLEGYNQSNRNDVWYSTDGVNWYEVPKTPWAPRHAASVYVFDNGLWMVAGNNMESDSWKLVRRQPKKK